MNRCLTLVAAVFAFATFAAAQNATGTLDGRVMDSSGGAVPGATVVIENQATNVRLTQQTNADGRFYQRYLLPGAYRTTVTKPGFNKYVQNDIQLDIEQTITLAIPMNVGDVSTSVEVTANSAQLETESSTVATTVSTRSILDLPFSGRSPMSLVTLVPGVIPSGGSNSPWISGGRNDYNDVTIDGTSVIVPENNVSHLQIGYTPIQDSVAEVSVVTNSLAPEYGRTGGGTINMSTKSGSNQFHSTLFEFNRNNIFNANSNGNIRAGVARGIVRYNQFGGTVGGPVEIPHIYNGKSKTFFFFAEQVTRQPNGVTDTTSVPTDAMRQGIFTGLTNGAGGGVGAPVTIYNPFDVRADPSCPASQPVCLRQPFANNVIPPSLINPTALKIQSFFPEPNSPQTITNGALQTANWHTTGSSRNLSDQFDARIDHNFSEKFRVFGRGSNANNTSTDFNGFANPGTSQGTGPNFGYSRNVTLNGIYTLSPTMILNINYGFARDNSVRYPFSQGTCPSKLGLPSSLDTTVDNCEFPQISMSGNNAGYNLGQSSFTTLYDFPYSHIFRGDVTKIMGKHTLKMGATWEKLFVNFTQLGSPDGSFNFSDQYTRQNASAGTSTTQGNGYATFLLGLPTGGSGPQFSYAAASASTYSGAYFQDDYKFSSKLTFNLGIRYDVDTPRTERYNRLSYFDINAPSPLQGQVASSALCPNCGNLKGAMMFVGTPNSAYGRHQTPTDLNNVAPRIGFAYHMFEKTVVRGAYGILYAPSMLQAAGTSGSSGTEGFTTSTPLNVSLDNGTTFIASLSNPIPNGVLKPLGAASGNNSGALTDIGNGIGDSFFIDYVNPVVQQWNFNVQQELKGNWIIQAAYLGSKGQHLPDGESSMTYDQLPASFLSLGSNLIANVPNPFYGVIKNPTSIYNSPTIQARYLLDAYPQYSGVNAFRKPQANSIYHSVTISAEHRYKAGFTALVAFTGGKLEDDASQVVNYIGQAGNKQDFYCRKCEKSVSAQDVSRRLVSSAVYELPVGRNRYFLGSLPKVADAFIGGWQINGIATFQSGIPIQISNGGNSANLGAPGIRPTDNGQDPQNTGSIGDRLNNYFKQSVFSQTPNYAFGNVGRFLPNVRGPGTHNLDFSLFKNYKPIERAMLQLRAEAYNATNSPTWSGPGTTVTSVSNFGIVTTKNGNRTMQMGIKLIF